MVGGDLLTSVYSRFNEGSGTADLQRQNDAWASWAEPGTSVCPDPFEIPAGYSGPTSNHVTGARWSIGELVLRSNEAPRQQLDHAPLQKRLRL
jgi:hypothetical protein